VVRDFCRSGVLRPSHSRFTDGGGPRRGGGCRRRGARELVVAADGPVLGEVGVDHGGEGIGGDAGRQGVDVDDDAGDVVGATALARLVDEAGEGDAELRDREAAREVLVGEVAVEAVVADEEGIAGDKLDVRVVDAEVRARCRSRARTSRPRAR
jgi:hypothetical protein